MPTYLMRNDETNEEKEVIVSISKMEEMRNEGWKIIHKPTDRSNLITQHGSTIGKTSSDWRDLVKKIKKGSGRGNTINT
jgi:hypothetical protein